MKLDKSTLKELIKEVLQEQTDPHAALVGAAAAALSRHAEKLAGKESKDVGKEIRDISRELSDEIADNFLKNFDAKQKD